MFSPEKRSVQGHLIAAFPYLSGAYKKGGSDVLAGSVVIGQGIMLARRKKFFRMRVVRH